MGKPRYDVVFFTREELQQKVKDGHLLPVYKTKFRMSRFGEILGMEYSPQPHDIEVGGSDLYIPVDEQLNWLLLMADFDIYIDNDVNPLLIVKGTRETPPNCTSCGSVLEEHNGYLYCRYFSCPIVSDKRDHFVNDKFKVRCGLPKTKKDWAEFPPQIRTHPLFLARLLDGLSIPGIPRASIFDFVRKYGCATIADNAMRESWYSIAEAMREFYISDKKGQLNIYNVGSILD